MSVVFQPPQFKWALPPLRRRKKRKSTKKAKGLQREEEPFEQHEPVLFRMNTTQEKEPPQTWHERVQDDTADSMTASSDFYPMEVDSVPPTPTSDRSLKRAARTRLPPSALTDMLGPAQSVSGVTSSASSSSDDTDKRLDRMRMRGTTHYATQKSRQHTSSWADEMVSLGGLAQTSAYMAPEVIRWRQSVERQGLTLPEVISAGRIPPDVRALLQEDGDTIALGPSINSPHLIATVDEDGRSTWLYRRDPRFHRARRDSVTGRETQPTRLEGSRRV
jgi:hypothetical protein